MVACRPATCNHRLHVGPQGLAHAQRELTLTTFGVDLDVAIDPAPPMSAGDYRCTFFVDVPAVRVVDAVTDEVEIMRWWTSVTAAERRSDGVHLRMGTQELVVTIAHAPGTGEVGWAVTTCEMVPDWVGTRPTFAVHAEPDGRTRVDFRHVGLVPELGCYAMCRAGWSHFMPSLRRYLEMGEGLPDQPRLASA